MDSIKKLDKNKTIDESTLPKEITPEFIFNEPIKKRNEKFLTAIHIIKKKLDEAENIKNETENGFKKLTNAQFKKRKNEIKQICIKLKNNVDKYKFIFKKYSEASRNEWTPAPICEEREIEIQKEKFNENCPLNHFILNLSDLSGFKKGIIKIEMKIGENNIEKEYKKSNFNFDQNIQINEKDLMRLPKNTLTIGLLVQKKVGFFCCATNEIEPYAMLEFKFDEFKKKSVIDTELNFLDTNKKITDVKIHIHAEIHSPIEQKEYETIKKKEMTIIKVFQPFKGDPIENYDIPENIQYDDDDINENKVKIVKKNDNNNINNNNNNKVNENKSIKNPPEIKGMPYKLSDFDAEELADPTWPSKFPTLKTMELAEKVYKEKMDKIEGRTPPELRTKHNKAIVQKNYLSNLIENGEMSIDDYLLTIKNAIDHDKKLEQYFKDKNETEKLKFVIKRLPILADEFSETLEVSKKMKK